MAGEQSKVGTNNNHNNNLIKQHHLSPNVRSNYITNGQPKTTTIRPGSVDIDAFYEDYTTHNIA